MNVEKNQEFHIWLVGAENSKKTLFFELLKKYQKKVSLVFTRSFPCSVGGVLLLSCYERQPSPPLPAKNSPKPLIFFLKCKVFLVRKIKLKSFPLHSPQNLFKCPQKKAKCLGRLTSVKVSFRTEKKMETYKLDLVSIFVKFLSLLSSLHGGWFELFSFSCFFFL